MDSFRKFQNYPKENSIISTASLSQIFGLPAFFPDCET